MSLKNCVIVFDNRSNGVFYSGENISGVIVLTMEKSKPIDAVVLKTTGKSFVRWHETKGHGKNRRRIVFHGKEIYFKTRNELLQRGSAKSMELTSGEHRFNFILQLPPNLPSSYEGVYGRVRYTVKVILERTKKVNLKHSMPFTVLSNVDLNLYPNFRTPVAQDISQDFYFLFSKQGMLKLHIEIPATGFVPGQIIPVTCSASNDSKTTIYEIKYSLLRRTMFCATYPYIKTRTEEMKIAECSSEGLVPNETKKMQSLLPIPPLPPSSLTVVSIIKIEYIFKVKARVSGMHTDLRRSFPITIGTVPYHSAVPPQVTIEQPSTSHSEVTLPPYSAPPSYEEAMAETRMTETEGTNPIIDFSPRYPLYQFSDESLPEKK